MNFERSALRTAAVMAAIVFGILAGTGWLVWMDFVPTERTHIEAVLTPPRIAMLVLAAIALAGGIGIFAFHIARATLVPARRMSQAIGVILAANAEHRLPVEGAPEIAELAGRVNALADSHSKAKADVAIESASARVAVEAERNRLGALMSELASSVIVCNREGTILLYNAAARRLFGASEEASLIGLGRSVFGVLDRELVMHALDRLERDLLAGESAPATQVVARGPGNGLVRIQVAGVTGQPSNAAGAGTAPAPALAGFVLLLSDVTADIEGSARRDILLQSVTEGGRAALANIRAAIENLLDFPDISPERRSQFHHIIRDEAMKLSAQLRAATDQLSEQANARWPLEEMRGSDLIAIARARIEARVSIGVGTDAVDGTVWLSVDSFSIARGLAYLATRLEEELDAREVELRLASAGRYAHLDLSWRGGLLAPESAFAWETDSFQMGGEQTPLTLKGVIERHGGEIWYQRDIPAQRAYFRLVLPIVATPKARRATRPGDSRPEYYDFDLFRSRASAHALDDMPLAELQYTVFDTETTGLNPQAGDEIISIGAVRIVNGRLLRGDTFDSLVDPRRRLLDASTAIHGITQDMLAGQPGIEVVLPRVHRFAAATVLVAHNAAFDLRFFELKEASTGVRFDQPVLDTLLLSAVIHPDQDTHALEAIADRLGIPVVGRHTALGDALVTGEVFIRFLALLQAQGIVTLGQARAASEKSFYARLKY